MRWCYYGRRTGSRIASQTGLQYALLMGVFGLIMPGIDNWAHAGGFAGGYLAGMTLDPLKPERVDHMVMALACLAVTLLALGGIVSHRAAAAAARVDYAD